MQTVIQILTSASRSLRDRIVNDPNLKYFGLEVSEKQRAGRPHGWAKLHSTEGEHGAINIEWLPSAKILMCRVVTRGGGRPAAITGAFVDYVLFKYKKEIVAMVIRPGQ